MADWIRISGPHHSLELFGIRLVGVNAENGKKFLFSVCLIVFVLLISNGLRWLLRLVYRSRRSIRVSFWSEQIVHLVMACVFILGLISIWFDEPARLATFLGLVSAGVAFALQRVITALAGYFIILRGRTFNIGDRIVMGGVRGDVVALGFFQTTIMEMGQPPPVQSDEPAMWVRARQYTGRIVTVTNDKIFTEPVYNYTRDFPYIWEEMHVPIPYTADRARAEQILLDAARRHTTRISDLSEEALQELERRFALRRTDFGPQVYWRLTDNWLEMTVRFIALDHAIRDLKNAMSRDIIAAFDAAGIGIASSTYDIVGMPPLHLIQETAQPTDGAAVDSAQGRARATRPG